MDSSRKEAPYLPVPGTSFILIEQLVQNRRVRFNPLRWADRPERALWCSPSGLRGLVSFDPLALKERWPSERICFLSRLFSFPNLHKHLAFLTSVKYSPKMNRPILAIIDENRQSLDSTTAAWSTKTWPWNILGDRRSALYRLGRRDFGRPYR